MTEQEQQEALEALIEEWLAVQAAEHGIKALPGVLAALAAERPPMQFRAKKCAN